jgi:hypothetical protein
MILETVMRPMVAFQETRLPKKLPNLWTELGTVAKQQLAFSWAQLIVRAKEEHAAEIRHDHSRDR